MVFRRVSQWLKMGERGFKRVSRGYMTEVLQRDNMDCIIIVGGYRI